MHAGHRPRMEQSAHLFEHEPVQIDDEPVLFEQGKEGARQTQADARVAPPHERLGAGYLSLAQIQLRLQVDDELARIQRLGHTVFQLAFERALQGILALDDGGSGGARGFAPCGIILVGGVELHQGLRFRCCGRVRSGLLVPSIVHGGHPSLDNMT